MKLKFSMLIICFTTILLTTALVVTSASAQQATSVESKSARPKNEQSSEKDIAENPLKPADTSSPRSTLDGFLDNVNRADALVMEADAALKASLPTIANDEAREIEIAALNLMMRARATLDLSKVPAPIEDDVLHGDHDGEAGDDGDDRR